VSGMAKENSRMSCEILKKYIHFAQTRIFQTTSQKLWPCIPFIHSGFTCISNMNKFMWYVTLSNYSKICCMAKRVKTFITMDSHFVRHMKPFPRAIFLSLGCKIQGSKGVVVFYCVECKQSFFSCNMLTLIGYSFFGK
jgi:hypothetical protein